ncbi:MAG: choice-of-anchor D domain-containing protein [Myxococcales bacterium]|nr:choice-of-anchor D domain-containing protein [Myxococcales bacterium]
MTSDDLGSGHPATVAFSRTYTIRNTGTAPLTLSGVAVDMPTCNNCVDVITQPALTTVPVGGSTTFTIQWTPDAPGSFGHSYRISSDAGNGPLFLFATSGGASAAPAPDLRVLHSGLPIPSMTTENLDVHEHRADRADCHDLGMQAANLDVTGVDSPGMPAPTNCTLVISGGSGTIIPGGSSTFHVTVTPQGTGSFSFQLRVFSNDTRFTMGYLFGVTGLIGLPSEIDIPGFPSASTDDAGSRSTGVSFVRTYTVNNSGSGSLTLGTASFSTSNCTASVSTVPASPVGAGGSTMIGITVTPTAAGAFACTFHLPNNDTTGAENPYDVTVSGTAIANIGNFGSMIGNYFGDNSCGIQGWSLKNVNGLKVDSFGSNPDDFPFAVGADPNVATATLLSIFGAPNHTCALTRVSNFTINIDCTNPGGGSCHEVASKL